MVILMMRLIQYFQLMDSGLVGCPGEAVVPHATMEHGPEQGHVPTHHQQKVENSVQEVVKNRRSVTCVHVQVEVYLPSV